MTAKTDVFRFEDPPPPAYCSRQVQAEQLRANPGRWALVAVFEKRSRASNLASVIRKGDSGSWRPAGDFDAVHRAVDGEFRVWARYLGDEGLPDDE